MALSSKLCEYPHFPRHLGPWDRIRRNFSNLAIFGGLLPRKPFRATWRAENTGNYGISWVFECGHKNITMKCYILIYIDTTSMKQWFKTNFGLIRHFGPNKSSKNGQKSAKMGSKTQCFNIWGHWSL